jgi:hypothetical protein
MNSVFRFQILNKGSIFKADLLYIFAGYETGKAESTKVEDWHRLI